MSRVIHRQAVELALKNKGWSQAQLAKEIGVSAQSVTNWVQGAGFPRPAKLLKLALVLQLQFEHLVQPEKDEPIVAFRKKAGTKTTEAHILKAKDMGALLVPLVDFLPKIASLRTTIASPEKALHDYERLQRDVAQVRNKLGLGQTAKIDYQALVAEFKNSGAVLIPVMWGTKLRHENALHILLPKQDATFVYLNLDTKLEDFKFWMAHELAHVYTPEIFGTDLGEDFADAFAGAFLFPIECAKHVYSEIKNQSNSFSKLQLLEKYAKEHAISVYTVYKQMVAYADSNGWPSLVTAEKTLHVMRNSKEPKLVSEALFSPLPPDPAKFIAASKNIFQTDFFSALQKMISQNRSGVGYVQQILDFSLRDSTAMHKELSR
jgi:transcriptional regulator with XRE-family HTH domain